MAERTGTGMFPRAVMECSPLLPLEEEGRLNDLPLSHARLGSVGRQAGTAASFVV